MFNILGQPNSAMLAKIQRNSFLFSLLLHLLLLASYLFVWPVSNINKKELPSLYIPSYAYQEQANQINQPPQPNQATQQQPPTITKKPSPVKSAIPAQQSSTIGLKVAKQQAKAPSKPISAKSSKQSQPITEVRSARQTQPVHLVGDKKLDQPLIELLGKALSSHLTYPKIAIDFNLHGTVYVGFMLHTSGLVTEAKVVKSSGTDILDQAALAGVQTMSPVSGVNQYLEKNRYLVVGVIFG